MEFEYINSPGNIYKVRGRKVYIKVIDKWIDDKYLPMYAKDKPDKLKYFGFKEKKNYAV
jgi:hypothetical protein